MDIYGLWSKELDNDVRVSFEWIFMVRVAKNWTVMSELGLNEYLWFVKQGTVRVRFISCYLFSSSGSAVLFREQKRWILSAVIFFHTIWVKNYGFFPARTKFLFDIFSFWKNIFPNEKGKNSAVWFCFVFW